METLLKEKEDCQQNDKDSDNNIYLKIKLKQKDHLVNKSI